MTVEELMYFLESSIEEGLIDNETEIRLAIKADEAIEASIEDVVLVDGTIYIAELEHEQYLSDDVKSELQW